MEWVWYILWCTFAVFRFGMDVLGLAAFFLGLYILGMQTQVNEHFLVMLQNKSDRLDDGDKRYLKVRGEIDGILKQLAKIVVLFTKHLHNDHGKFTSGEESIDPTEKHRPSNN